VNAVAGSLRAALGPGYEVRTWLELNPSVGEIIKIQRTVLLAVGFLFLVIAIIGVVNTLLMSVIERTREIGTMMAVGVRRGRIALLFVLEAATLALLGGGIGVGSAYLLVGILRSRGGLVMPVGNTATFTLIPAVAEYQVVVAVSIATVGAILGALWPAVRAARLRPVEALRGM
jgi:putative ABC transport system permease protein